MARTQMDTVIGILLIVLGAISLLGWLDLGWLVTVAAVAAIVVGILILMGRFSGGTVMGVILLIVGVLLLIPQFDLGRTVGAAMETIAAVILIVLGVLKLIGKW